MDGESLASWRNQGWNVKWQTLSFLPQQPLPKCPGARHLTPCLYCFQQQPAEDWLQYGSVVWIYLYSKQDVGHWRKNEKQNHTQAVKTFPLQINIKYDINTIPLWMYPPAAYVRVFLWALDGRGCKKEVRCEMVPNVPLRSFPTDFRPIVAIPGSFCTQTQTHITTPEAVDVHWTEAMIETVQ